MLRNFSLPFWCPGKNLRVESADSPFTNAASEGQVLRVPISHGEGNYFADPDTIKMLERDDRVLFRYCTEGGEITDAANPNGSLNNIAGITNEARNIMGMMPHPERCCESLVGGVDGRAIFESLLATAIPDVVLT